MRFLRSSLNVTWRHGRCGVVVHVDGKLQRSARSVLLTRRRSPPCFPGHPSIFEIFRLGTRSLAERVQRINFHVIPRASLLDPQSDRSTKPFANSRYEPLPDDLLISPLRRLPLSLSPPLPYSSALEHPYSGCLLLCFAGSPCFLPSAACMLPSAPRAARTFP